MILSHLIQRELPSLNLNKINLCTNMHEMGKYQFVKLMNCIKNSSPKLTGMCGVAPKATCAVGNRESML